MAQRFWRKLDTLLIIIAGAILMASVLHVTADVLLKLFFSRPVPGTIVYVSNYYMTMIVFLPLASAEMRDQHIVVDLWPDRAPAWLSMLSLRFSWAFSSAVYFLMGWNTLKDAMRKYAEGEYTLDQSGLVITWPSYFVLPVGMGIVAVLLAFKVFNPTLSIAPREMQTNE